MEKSEWSKSIFGFLFVRSKETSCYFIALCRCSCFDGQNV